MNKNKKDLPNLSKWADAGEKIGNVGKIIIPLLPLFIIAIFKGKKST